MELVSRLKRKQQAENHINRYSKKEHSLKEHIAVDKLKNLQEISPEIQAEILDLLSRISQSMADLNDIYYSLFDNLTALYNSFPTVYQQVEQSVKLPTNDDAAEVVNLKNDFNMLIEHLKDPQYLSSFMGNQSNTF